MYIHRWKLITTLSNGFVSSIQTIGEEIKIQNSYEMFLVLTNMRLKWMNEWMNISCTAFILREKTTREREREIKLTDSNQFTANKIHSTLTMWQLRDGWNEITMNYSLSIFVFLWCFLRRFLGHSICFSCHIFRLN